MSYYFSSRFYAGAPRAPCAYSPPMPKSGVVRALGAKSAKNLHVQVFGTQHPGNAKTHKTVRDRPRPKIAWAGLYSGSGLRPLGGSRGAPPVDPSGYWEESSHGRLGTHHVQGVDTVCAACKALAERAERARGKFFRKGFKSAKTLAMPLKAQNLQNCLGPEGPDHKTPFWRRKSSESSKLLKFF